MSKNIIILMDDIHLEGRTPEMHSDFSKSIQNKIETIKKNGDHPIVLCAGDIGENIQGVIWASQFECDVIYVCGNHEFWDGDLYEVPNNIKEFIKDKEINNIHFLNNESIVINGVRFIGSTLWTSLGKYLPIYNQNYTIKYFNTMGDFKRTTAKNWYTEENIINLNQFMTKHGVDKERIDNLIVNKLYNPLIEIEENNLSEEYIKNTLNETFEGETIVVSHHLPAYESWMKKMKMNKQSILGDKVNNEQLFLDSAKGNLPTNKDLLIMTFYTNDLKYMMFSKNAPIYWFHGHLHQDNEDIIGRTKICSSPVGYLRQSNTMKYKEIPLDNTYLDIAKYVKLEIENFDWNLNLLTPLRDFEKLILKFDMCINMGIMSSLDFIGILNNLKYQHQINLDNLTLKTQEWLQKFVYFKNSEIEEQKLDLYLIKKIINFNDIVFPEVLSCEVNEFSFSSYETYKEKNPSGLDYYHYKSWQKDISKIRIQISQYKNNLITFCNNYSK